MEDAWRLVPRQENHDAQSFDLMPSLADALENSGCHDAEILSHCRVQTDHVRGCWMVDAILPPTTPRHRHELAHRVPGSV